MTPFGQRLKHWRRLRRVSQLDVSLRSGVSPRHISFLETGRSRPGRDVILRLADALDVPPRDCNELLRSAGFGPAFGERSLDDGELTPFRDMLDRMLVAHEPFPAVIITAWWEFVAANRAARRMMATPPVDGPLNLIDVLLAPGPRRRAFVDFAETAHMMVDRLRREASQNPDPRVAEVLERARTQIRAIPRPPAMSGTAPPAMRVRLKAGDQVLSLVATIARFTDAMDATLDDLRVELLFPADESTERFFRQAATLDP